MSQMLADVEAVRGGGLRDLGDATKVEGGFSSVMGVVVCD